MIKSSYKYLYVKYNIHINMIKKGLATSFIIFLILIICGGFVSAQDNSTQNMEFEEVSEDVQIDKNEQIVLSSNESGTTIEDKKDANFDIGFEEVFIQNCWTRPEGPSLFIYPAAENMTGNFTVHIDNKYYAKGGVDDFLDPFNEIWAPFYGLGNHTIKVQYSGDDTYKPLTKAHIFSVELINIRMPNEEYVLENDAISISMVPKASGTATLYINGEKKKTIKVKPLDDDAADVGYENNVYIELDEYVKFGETYNVSVTFNGKNEGKTLKASKSGKITNVTYKIEILAEDDYEYGFNTIDIITPKFIIKDNLNAFIDGEKVKVYQLEYDEYNPITYYVKFDKCKVGTHAFSVNYTGDDKYPAKSVNTTFKVYSKIYIEEDTALYNSSLPVKLKLPSDATGNLTVYLGKDNESYEFYASQALVNGSAKIDVLGERIGKYYLKATYDGNYEVENITDYTIDIQPVITYPTSMIWGEKKYVTIQTDKDANGTLYFYRMWKLYKQVDVINGSAKIPLDNLPIGKYYDGETTILYNSSAYELELWDYLLSVKPKLTLTGPTSMYYGDTASYSLKVYGANGKVLGKGKTVTIKIGTKSFKVKTNAKGIATLKIPNTITAGKYTVKAIYSSFSTSKKFTVKQVLTLKKVTVKKSAKKLIITATLKKGKTVIKSKLVTFKFNGKTYKTKTNAKGIAKVTIPKSVLSKLKVGKKLTYQSTYIKNTVKQTVKIQK